MHRQIAGALPCDVVHHKNRNTLDNRRENLLLLSPREHSWEHAKQRLFDSNPDPHTACAHFLATRGITALCIPTSKTEQLPTNTHNLALSHYLHQHMPT